MCCCLLSAVSTACGQGAPMPHRCLAKGRRNAMQLDKGRVTQRDREYVSNRSKMGGFPIPDGPSGAKSPSTPLQGASHPRAAVLRRLQGNFLRGACPGKSVQHTGHVLTVKNGGPDFYHHIFKFFKPVPKHYLSANKTPPKALMMLYTLWFWLHLQASRTSGWRKPLATTVGLFFSCLWVVSICCHIIWESMPFSSNMTRTRMGTSPSL